MFVEFLALAAQREAEEERRRREEEEKLAKMAQIEREKYEQLKREQEEIERLVIVTARKTELQLLQFDAKFKIFLQALIKITDN